VVFSIYALFDPRTLLVRYVGKTTQPLQRRVRMHTYARFLAAPTRKNRWLRGLLREGLMPGVAVLEECLTLNALNEAERFHIAYWRCVGAPLTNLASGGGDGFGLGRTHTVAARRKISLANQGLVRGELHAIRTSRARGGRPFVDQFGVRYETVNGAARSLGLKPLSVRMVLRGVFKQTHGFMFRYVSSA
jgi:hypothetical protein